MSVLAIAPLLAGLLACLAPPDEVAVDDRGARDAEAKAQRLETEGALVSAAEAWESVVAEAVDPETRGHAAFRAQKAYREAARSSDEHELLCEAQRVVLTNLERADLGDDERHDFDGFREAIAAALSTTGTSCEEDPLVPFLGLEASEQATILPEPERGIRPVRASPPDTSMSAPVGVSEAKTRSQVAPQKIAGGVLLGAGAALLGAATYGIIEDYRAGQAIIVYAPKNNSVGLTEAEIAALRAEQERARLGSRLAIGAGISAGAALITSAVLLALPSTPGPKERRKLGLQPSLSPMHAGLRLRGSF